MWELPQQRRHRWRHEFENVLTREVEAVDLREILGFLRD